MGGRGRGQGGSRALLWAAWVAVVAVVVAGVAVVVAATVAAGALLWARRKHSKGYLFNTARGQRRCHHEQEMQAHRLHSVAQLGP